MCAPKRKRKPPTPESKVLKAVLQYLAACHLGTVHRNNVGMVWTGGHTGEGRPVRFGTPGQADVTVELKDSTRCIHVECKAPAGRLSAHQSAWLAAQAARGHVCIVARSAQDVCDALGKAGFTVPQLTAKRRIA
jgi:hypothetical protein